MRDSKGKELKVGDKVAVYLAYGITSATLVKIKDCNNQRVRRIREGIEINRYKWYTQENLEDHLHTFTVQLDGEPTVKKIHRKKNILKI